MQDSLSAGVTCVGRVEEHDPCIWFTFESIMLLSHVKPKVCDPEAPRNCRCSRIALHTCIFLTSTSSDWCAQLTCRCSSVRRASHKRSFESSCPSCSDTATSSAPSAGRFSACRASSTSCSSGWLLLLHLPVGQRLPHRPTADSAVPDGWAASAGAGASSGATGMAAVGHGGALRCRVGNDYFRPVCQGPRDGFCCSLQRRGGEGVRPGGEGSAAGMCGGRARSVSARMYPQLGTGRARAASWSTFGSRRSGRASWSCV